MVGTGAEKDQTICMHAFAGEAIAALVRLFRGPEGPPELDASNGVSDQAWRSCVCQIANGGT